ncbi:MAG: hypothetical protein PHG08_00670 [Bacilli bacterium]|nr:hypothetical protein [Bacilli bacterium]
MKADDLLLIADSVTNLNTPIFVQVGYNRFDVVTYTINEDGYVLLVLADNASNPKVETLINEPEPKGVA